MTKLKEIILNAEMEVLDKARAIIKSLTHSEQNLELTTEDTLIAKLIECLLLIDEITEEKFQGHGPEVINAYIERQRADLLSLLEQGNEQEKEENISKLITRIKNKATLFQFFDICTQDNMDIDAPEAFFYIVRLGNQDLYKICAFGDKSQFCKLQRDPQTDEINYWPMTRKVLEHPQTNREELFQGGFLTSTPFSLEKLNSCIHFDSPLRLVQQDELDKTVSSKFGTPFNLMMNPQLIDIQQMNPQLEKMFLDLDIQDSYGANILMWAVEKTSIVSIQSLIAAGVNVNASTDKGYTALIFAITHTQRNKEIVEALIAAGADVNAADAQGRPALMFAIRRRNKEILAALIKAGADVNASNAQGLPALMIAIAQGDNEIVEALIKAGADVNAADAQGFPALIFAITQRNKEIVEALINAGADVNVANAQGSPALKIAISQEDKEIVEALINAGADVNAANAKGTSMLMLAIGQGDKEIVEALIKAGAGVNASNAQGLRALMIAIAQGDNEIVEALIKAGADVNAADAQGFPALIFAITQRNKEIVEALIKAGADVNASNAQGLPALMIAISQEDKEIVEALITAGANVNAKNEKGWTPLSMAASYGHLDIAKALIAAGARENILSWASKDENMRVLQILIDASADINKVVKDVLYAYHINDPKVDHHVVKRILKTLIKSDADVNAADSRRRMALTLAADTGDKEIVEALIAAGADVNADYYPRGRALALAAYNGHKEIVEALIAAGADVNANASSIAIPYAGTALMSAAINGNIDCVKALIAAGADVNGSDSLGWHTALELAARYKHPKIVSYLIEHGANVHTLYPLISAAFYGSIDCVKALIQAGANVNASDGGGYTALMYAAENKHPKIVIYLIHHGANVNARNKDNETALLRLATWSSWHINEEVKSTLNILIEAGSDLTCADLRHVRKFRHGGKDSFKEICSFLIPALVMRLGNNIGKAFVAASGSVSYFTLGTTFYFRYCERIASSRSNGADTPRLIGKRF